jgi:two-component system, OmpR family, phosphate regulon sensor histidine kinase PhoR
MARKIIAGDITASPPRLAAAREPGRHLAPAALGFVHDGIVVNIDASGLVELSAAVADNPNFVCDCAIDTAETRDDFCATLLAMASHDLRQPLQVIVGTIDLLDQMLSKGVHAHLDRVKRATTELAGKLNLLVDALYLSEGANGRRREPVRMDLLLAELALELAEAARLKRITFRVAPTSARVLSHPVLLGSMLRNLMRNAIDYTPLGGRVLVACRRRAAQMHIEVRDSGVGIPVDQLTSVFRAFHRADSSRADGLGLGLFIVRRAADLLGHRVEVRSAIGRGSCFVIVAESLAQSEPSRFGSTREARA